MTSFDPDRRGNPEHDGHAAGFDPDATVPDFRPADFDPDFDPDATVPDFDPEATIAGPLAPPGRMAPVDERTADLLRAVLARQADAVRPSAAGLERIWRSICSDKRHTEVEVVRHAPAHVRSFADWDMKLARRKQAPNTAAADVCENFIEALYRQPAQAPTILGLLASRDASFDERAEALARRSTLAIVMDLVKSMSVPHLLAQGAFSQLALSSPRARVAELAQLLTAADPTAAFESIEVLHQSAASIPALFASVFEPAARALGDLWCADDCSEDEMTIGLSRLQTAVRRIGCCAPELSPPRPPMRAVLVATQPGEQHRLGCAMDAEALWEAGWDTHCEYPATDQALERLLSQSWFDALDLSLSPALPRAHCLPRMAETILRARGASRNPALVVVVGGRVFCEQGDASLSVGADASSASSMQIGPLLLSVLPPTPRLI
jgi:hypothetical protein